MPIIDVSKAHPAINLHLPTDDQIDYFLVGPHEEVAASVPELLRAPFLFWLGALPKSGIQVISPFAYQQMNIARNNPQPIRFAIIYDANFSEWINYILEKPALLRVFFWFTQDTSAGASLSNLKQNVLIFPGDDEIREKLTAAGVSPELLITHPTQVVERVMQEARKKAALEGAELVAQRQLIDELAEGLCEKFFPNAVQRFRPLHVNLHQVRQLYGLYDPEYWQYDDKNDFSQRTKSLIASFHAVAQSLQVISSFEHEGKQFEGYPPAAIVAFPSNNPLLAKALHEGVYKLPKEKRSLAKAVLSVRFAEQDTNTYESFPLKPRDGWSLEAFQIGAGEVIAHTEFFDVMGYLHGSFHCAPYLRAPLKGKSVAMQHAAFAPGLFSVHATEAAKHGMIKRFSEALGAAVNNDIRKTLQEYPGGLVALSDLPVEWIDCNGVPLCFLQDISRVPETVPSNMLAQFARNHSQSYEVTPATPTKTLIICGVSDESDPVRQAFEMLVETWKAENVPWRWERCSSVSQLVGVVNEFRPEFLIFDSHGRFRDNDQGSEIQMGNEWLNGHDVVKHFPQVPLVMMSTCWGAPLYGRTNTIAHAFFEAGTMALVTSLLPIDVLKGSILSTRVLNNLVYACNHAIHPHWSSFISHNIRTSLLDDMQARVRKRYIDKLVDMETYRSIRSEWLLNSLVPNTRIKAYHTAAETVRKCFQSDVQISMKNLFDNKDYVPEFMCYTTLGRADLVQFKVWNDARHNSNPFRMTAETLRSAAIIEKK